MRLQLRFLAHALLFGSVGFGLSACHTQGNYLQSDPELEHGVGVVNYAHRLDQRRPWMIRTHRSDPQPSTQSLRTEVKTTRDRPILRRRLVVEPVHVPRQRATLGLRPVQPNVRVSTPGVPSLRHAGVRHSNLGHSSLITPAVAPVRVYRPRASTTVVTRPTTVRVNSPVVGSRTVTRLQQSTWPEGSSRMPSRMHLVTEPVVPPKPGAPLPPPRPDRRVRDEFARSPDRR